MVAVYENEMENSTIFETAALPNGQVQTLFRTIIHSTPPVNAITEPRGKINEAFLTVFCRNADIVETSARNLMRKNHPGRHVNHLRPAQATTIDAAVPRQSAM